MAVLRIDARFADACDLSPPRCRKRPVALLLERAAGVGAGASTSTDALAAPPDVLLYNLEVDPSEQFDLSAERPEIVAELRELARAHAASVEAGPDQPSAGLEGYFEQLRQTRDAANHTTSHDELPLRPALRPRC